MLHCFLRSSIQFLCIEQKKSPVWPRFQHFQKKLHFQFTEVLLWRRKHRSGALLFSRLSIPFQRHKGRTKSPGWSLLSYPPAWHHNIIWKASDTQIIFTNVINFTTMLTTKSLSLMPTFLNLKRLLGTSKGRWPMNHIAVYRQGIIFPWNVMCFSKILFYTVLCWKETGL